MAAVDATEVVAEAIEWSDTTPYDEAETVYVLNAQAALAALFSRAGIEGEGTIALTRDAEGRVGLGTMERAWPDVAWTRSLGQLVPVEDDEEGRDDG